MRKDCKYIFNKNLMQSLFMKKHIYSFQNIFLLISVVFLISCQNEIDSRVKEALKLAGDNRPELEKVLKHYGIKSEDRLKLQAAKFLIANMDAHYFFYSDDLNRYNESLKYIFSLNKPIDPISSTQDSLFSQLPSLNFWMAELSQTCSALSVADSRIAPSTGLKPEGK